MARWKIARYVRIARWGDCEENMTTYEITAEMDLKKIIAESREVAQALNEFADNLERIEKKYAEPQKSEEV